MNKPAGDSDFPRQGVLESFGDAYKKVLPGTITAIKAEGLEIDLTREPKKGAFGVALFCREKIRPERPGPDPLALELNGRKLVVKVLVEPDNAQAFGQFLREFQILSSDLELDDVLPHFVRARAGARDSQPYIIMESIDGVYLREKAAERSWGVEKKLEVIRSLFYAYDRVHKAGLVHGDPSIKNVLIDRQDRIRIIDWGSGRAAHKAYGQTTTARPGGTPDVAHPGLLKGQQKATVETDLFAAGSISFDLLTGEASKKYPLEADQLRRLTEAGVPAPYAAILAKTLRIKDSQFADDQKDDRLFKGPVDVVCEMDKVRQRRESRERLAQRAWPAAILALVLGTALFLTFGWMRDARLLALQAEQAELDAELRQVTNLEYRAVKSAHQQLEEDRRQMHGEARSADRARREELQATLLKKTKDVLRLSRDLSRQQPIRESLDQILDVASWTASAPTIARSLKEVSRLKEQIDKKLEAGATAEADMLLFDVQKQLAVMVKENQLAHQAALARSAYEHELEGISPRVLAHASYARVKTLATDAESAWEAGEFERVKQLFGQATQRLNELLGEIETPEERTAREQKQAGQLREQLAEVEQRLQAMRGERDQSLTEVGQLKTQITTLTGQHAGAIAKLEEERKGLQDRIAKSETRASDSERKLGEATKQIAAQKKTIDEQAPTVAAFRAQTPPYQELKQKHDALAEQYSALETRALSQSGASGVEAAKAVAELRKQIDRLDTTDRDAAFKALGAALGQLDKVIAQRTEQLKEYDEKSPTIQTLDQAVSQQESLVRAALNKLDQTDSRMFGELEEKVTAQRELKRKLIEVEGLRETSQRVAIVDGAIKRLVEQQKPYQAGQARTADAASVVDAVKVAREVAPVALVSTLGHAPPQGELAVGERRVVQVKGVEVGFIWCPALNKPFCMDSPTKTTPASPRHVMIPQGFWIAEFECFQKLWGAVMGTSPQNLPLGTGDLLPVYNISPNEILEFIRKFNEELQKQNTAFVGWAANLPTHEQLVYALRAGSTTEFCFGDDEVKLGDFAWYAENSDGKHHPVGTKKPNAWGIHDMHGSVYELTSKNLSEGDSKSRWSFFTRGGSIKSTQEECRWGVEAGFLLPRGTGSHHLGFRLVLVQEEESEPKKRK